MPSTADHNTQTHFWGPRWWLGLISLPQSVKSGFSHIFINSKTRITLLPAFMCVLSWSHCNGAYFRVSGSSWTIDVFLKLIAKTESLNILIYKMSELESASCSKGLSPWLSMVFWAGEKQVFLLSEENHCQVWSGSVLALFITIFHVSSS